MLRVQKQPFHLLNGSNVLKSFKFDGSYLENVNCIKLTYKNNNFNVRGYYTIQTTTEGSFNNANLINLGGAFGVYKFWVECLNIIKEDGHYIASGSIGLVEKIGNLEFQSYMTYDHDKRETYIYILFKNIYGNYITTGNIKYESDCLYGGHGSYTNIAHDILSVELVNIQNKDMYTDIRYGYLLTFDTNTTNGYTRRIVNYINNDINNSMFHMQGIMTMWKTPRSLKIPNNIKWLRMYGVEYKKTSAYYDSITKIQKRNSLGNTFYFGNLPEYDILGSIYGVQTNMATGGVELFNFSVLGIDHIKDITDTVDYKLVYDGKDELFHYYHFAAPLSNTQDGGQIFDNYIIIDGHILYNQLLPEHVWNSTSVLTEKKLQNNTYILNKIYNSKHIFYSSFLYRSGVDKYDYRVA